MKNKKSQSSEFIGVVLLVLVLVIILLFNKLNSARTSVIRTESLVKGSDFTYIISAVSKFPYITEKGISLNELMGDYVCYEKEEVSYGAYVGSINIPEAIAENLDLLFGNGRWYLELDKKYCLNPDKTIIKETCKIKGKEFTSYDFIFPLPCTRETREGKIYIVTK